MSERTRLEYFAAHALTGLFANPAYFGVTDIEKAALALSSAQALGELIDRQFDPDYLDPDPNDGGKDA